MWRLIRWIQLRVKSGLRWNTLINSLIWCFTIDPCRTPVHTNNDCLLICNRVYLLPKKLKLREERLQVAHNPILLQLICLKMTSSTLASTHHWLKLLGEEKKGLAVLPVAARDQVQHPIWRRTKHHQRWNCSRLSSRRSWNEDVVLKL